MAFKRSRKDFEADLQKQQSPFVHYGTPLPPLDDDSRDDGSYVPVWKQEVTDDRGRKRLHGAFTGGFSAGYFNSVGSKEGWTPSTFVSSRTNRAKEGRQQVLQKPEDFMDEEDIREQEESRNVATNEEFAGFGTASDAGYKNALMDLLQPTNDTMGIRLLNKMGWKNGHGIGPKVKRRADPDDNQSDVHLFAPDDVPMLILAQKQDYNGLGFARQIGTNSSSTQVNPASRLRSRTQSDEDEDEDDGRPGLRFSSQKMKLAKGKRGAFGVGVLNDTGSDEEDPYSMGPKIAYNKTLGGDKKVKKSKFTTGSNANPLLKNKPVFIPKRLGPMSSALRKCHDGRLPLDGFVLADELDKFSSISLDGDKYKPPQVPDDWTPSRALSMDSHPENVTYRSTAEAAKLSSHTSSTRGAVLGEASLPGKSVFDFLTPAAREKLMKATGKINLPPALSESLPGTSSTNPPSQSSAISIPQLDPQTAIQALSRLLSGGFTPYSEDASKAARYKSYLQSQADSNDSSTQGLQNPTSPAPRPSSMSQEDYMIELQEFARAAEVFKPVSGLIASRFTTSTQPTPPNQTTTTTATDPILPDLLSKPSFSTPKSPAEQAASIGMFGPLTRSVANFYPMRLLCKRFGVALPTHAELPQSTGPSSTSTADRFQSTGYQRAGTDETDDRRVPTSAGTGPGTVPAGSTAPSTTGRTSDAGQLAIEAPNISTTTSSYPEPQASQSTTTIDPDRNEALEQERPGAAVFRAIFGSDGEDDDD